MSTVLAGVFAKAYILSTGTRATWGALDATSGTHKGAAPSSLSEVTIIRNADLNVDDSEGDGSRRASVWKLSMQTQIDGSVDLEIPWDPTDANFILLRNAKFARKTVAMVFLDQAKDVVGAQGPWADWGVFGWKVSQPIDKEQMVKVTLKPSPSAVGPEWAEVTAGS